jgi:hypothetical protein
MPNIYNNNENDNKIANDINIYKSKFGIEPDLEKLKDELMKFKQQYNKKLKDLHSLKKEYFKLQDEQNQTIKVFEDILNDPKTNLEIFQSLKKQPGVDGEDNDINKIDEGNQLNSSLGVVNLREVFIS